ncbi:MAG: hypothetical protein V3W34_20455 [Phycisphaerae bacterium]
MNDHTLQASPATGWKAGPTTPPGIRVWLRASRLLLVLMLAVPAGCETMMSRRHVSGDAALLGQSRFETSQAYDNQSQAAPARATDRKTVKAARAQVLAFINQLEELDVEQPTGAVGKDDPPSADRTGDAAGGHEQVTSPDPIVHAAPSVQLRDIGGDRTSSAEAHGLQSVGLGLVGSQPPRLLRVSIRQPREARTPAVQLVAPETHQKTPKPSRTANMPIDTSAASGGESGIDALIAELEDRVAAAPNDMHAQWRLALLRLATDDTLRAHKRSPDMLEDSASLLSGAVDVMIATRRALEDPVVGVDDTMAAVNGLRAKLRERAALSIPSVALCSQVQGYGVYEVLADGTFRPYVPNQAIVYFEVKGFQSESVVGPAFQPVNDRLESRSHMRFRTVLSERLEVRRLDGDLMWEHEESTIEDFCSRRREDFFVAQRIVLPATLGEGEYVLKVTVEDALADKRTQAIHHFRIGSGLTTSATP